MDSNPDSKGYNLPRDAPESARLEAQHHIWVSNIGYLLHPTITASLPEQATIGEVATGTGIWLINHARSTKTLGKSHHYFGLDLSSAQFPSKHPDNVGFDELNILEAVPEDWKDRFDALHVRLLVCGMSGTQDWSKALTNLLAMLKPGGWLQWEELDFEGISARQSVSGADAGALTRFMQDTSALLRSMGRMSFEAARLDSLFAKAGFEDVQKDVFASDRVADTRAGFTEATLAAGQGAIKMVFAAQGEEENSRLNECEELGKKARNSAEGGNAYFRGDLIVAIGRKPS